MDQEELDNFIFNNASNELAFTQPTANVYIPQTRVYDSSNGFAVPDLRQSAFQFSYTTDSSLNSIAAQFEFAQSPIVRWPDHVLHTAKDILVCPTIPSYNPSSYFDASPGATARTSNISPSTGPTGRVDHRVTVTNNSIATGGYGSEPQGSWRKLLLSDLSPDCGLFTSMPDRNLALTGQQWPTSTVPYVQNMSPSSPSFSSPSNQMTPPSGDGNETSGFQGVNNPDETLSHQGQQKACPICPRKLAGTHELRRHMESVHKTALTCWVCSLCEWINIRWDNLRRDKAMAHARKHPTSNGIFEEWMIREEPRTFS